MALKRVVFMLVFLFCVAPAILPAESDAGRIAGATHGISYRFESVTRGFGEQRVAGTVEAKGTQMRMNIAHGDGVTFPDHSFALTSSDGRRIAVFDPAAKTY